MTEGNVTSQLFRFSVPIVLGNIFQQLYNTADAMIVGKMIGNNAFAAVSVANPIMSVVLFFLVGLSMGVGILLAQWYGAQDIKMFKVQYSTALIAGCVFTVAASLLCIVCSRWMLLAANTPAEIMEDTNWYLRIVFLLPVQLSGGGAPRHRGFPQRLFVSGHFVGGQCDPGYRVYPVYASGSSRGGGGDSHFPGVIFHIMCDLYL